MHPSRRRPLPSTFCSGAFALAVAALLAACGGGDAPVSDGVKSANAARAEATLYRVSAEPMGLACAAGGIRIEAGLDTDGDGTLATAEVSATQFVCNGTLGAPGAAGTAGTPALVRLVPEPAGARCAAGGTLVQAGADANRNGVLDAPEIASESAVCRGADGAAGAAGAAGASGVAGATGSTGAAGVGSLVAIVPESAGANCTHAGSKVTAGPDANGNGVLDAGEVTSTTYLCNGAPGPGVTWFDAPTSTQAVAGGGYFASGVSPVTVTLPTNPPTGSVFSIVGVGAGGWTIAQNAGQRIVAQNLPGSIAIASRDIARSWYSVASSADGMKLVAAAYNTGLFTSVDGGATWSLQFAAPSAWTAVASSADGTRLAAVVSNGFVYTSADSGATWTQRENSRAWLSIASSTDGRYLVAVGQGGVRFTSSDFGVTWTSRVSGSTTYTAVASSADGSKLVAVSQGDAIFVSGDFGATWTANASAGFRNWTAVSMSADGARVQCVPYNGQIHISTDAGVTFTPRETVRTWYAAASSADGMRLVAGAYGGAILISTDGGVNWKATSRSGGYTRGLASSADGLRIAGGELGGTLFTIQSFPTTTTGVTGSVSGAQYDALDLVHAGGGLFVPRSFQTSAAFTMR